MVYHACKSDGCYQKLTGATIPPRRLFMVPLIAAAVLGVSQPAAYADFDPPGPDTFCADPAVTNPFCQLSTINYAAALILPEIGGAFSFISNGSFTIGTDGARLSGEIIGGGYEFSVAVNFRGRKPADPGTVDMLVRPECGVDPNTWSQFTEISGEVVGLPGSVFVDARYAITKRSKDAQFGEGANTHNTLLGLFARINFELVDNPHDAVLPVGPFLGEVSVELTPGVVLFVQPPVDPLCFPHAEPDLTGTWTGTIDCVGFDSAAGTGAAPAERFFSAAVLEIGRSANLLDVGPQYSVRLTREAGNGQSFCANVPNNPDSATGGQGVLVETQRQATRVHFRFEGDTLRARELMADGFDGTQLCKWSFTLTSTTPPTVADACSPVSCMVFGPNEQCNENATVCGQGEDCGGLFNCTCDDGFVGNGYGDTGCTSAP